MNLRTSEKIFLDYNPSDNDSWVYKLIENDKSVLIKSTYKDNPFLPKAIREELDNLVNVDEGYYRIYALGEQAVLKSTIYSHYRYEDFNLSGATTYYGLDIGYNHPTALVQVQFVNKTAYVKEEIYSSNLTTADLLELFLKKEIRKDVELLVDSARPDVIEELRRAGYKAKGANKKVKEGITAVKSMPLVIHSDSTNIHRELRNYKWRSIGDMIQDEPVKLYDDALDAMRYAIYHHYLKQTGHGMSDLTISFINL